jgi:putative endonuclease
MAKHHVYVLRSLADQHFYVGLTNDLPARLEIITRDASHPRDHARRLRLFIGGCLNRSDAAQREKYLKSAWGKRYLKGRLRRYLTG